MKGETFTGSPHFLTGVKIAFKIIRNRTLSEPRRELDPQVFSTPPAGFQSQNPGRLQCELTTL